MIISRTEERRKIQQERFLRARTFPEGKVYRGEKIVQNIR